MLPTERAFQTIIEMFNERRYDILEHDDERIIASKENGEMICAFIPKLVTKFNVEQFEAFVSMIKQMEITHCLIVYKDSATSHAKKMVDISPDIEIELFSIDELQYNLTKHIWVPQHSLYARKGSKESEKFKDKIPAILRSDPVSKFYAFQKGDIIKIIRHNGFVMFRIVK